MTHDELRSLTGGYALGALSEAERRELEAHLPTCADCAREVSELRAVANGLAYAVPQHDPPAHLRERVLRAAVASSQSTVVEMPPRPARPMLPTWFAVAASVAAVALGFYSLTLRQRIEVLQERLRETSALVEDAQRQSAVARAVADEATRTASILSADDVRRINLAGQKTAPGAAGSAFWSASRRELLLSAANLPSLRAGRQYQLWVIPAGSMTPVSAGMLDLTADGRVRTIADTSSVSAVAAVAISEEPAGGVPAPTGAIVLLGSL